MMKKHTGIIYGLLLIAVCLAGSMVHTTRAMAEETGVTYTYENGTLTFQGSGAIEKQVNGEENSWRSYKDTATKLVVEVGITEIGDSAFSGFTKLQEISLPKGLKLLGDNCFEKCSSLTSVSIPRRVTTWRDYCFKDCTSLTSVSIGRALQEDTVKVGENPFLGDKVLENVTVEEGHPYLYVQDHALIYQSKYGWNTLVAYPEGLTDTAYCIPEGVDTVGDKAFAGNQSIQKLSMKYLKIPTIYGLDNNHGSTYILGGTLYPQPINLGASFNTELARQMAVTTAYESRAADCPWFSLWLVSVGSDSVGSDFVDSGSEDSVPAGSSSCRVVEEAGCSSRLEAGFVGLEHPASSSGSCSARSNAQTIATPCFLWRCNGFRLSCICFAPFTCAEPISSIL